MRSNKLRYELQVRKNRVLNSTSQTYTTELTRFFNFILGEPLLSGILGELRVNLPDFDSWYKTGGIKKGIYLPDNDLDAVKLDLVILEKLLSDNDLNIIMNLAGYTGCYDTNITLMVSHSLNLFFSPFVEYIDSKIEDNDSIIYLLEKFKKFTEWFEQRYFFDLYQSLGEAGLDRAVRKFLFQNGIEYPFSDPKSPSGKADIVSDIDTEDPLVLEIKVYDPTKSYKQDYIKKGFRQAYKYSNDYNKNVGYLLVFNASEDLINIKLKNEIGGNTKIEFNGKILYIVIVDIYPDKPSASVHKKQNVIEINEDFLIST